MYCLSFDCMSAYVDDPCLAEGCHLSRRQCQNYQPLMKVVSLWMTLLRVTQDAWLYSSCMRIWDQTGLMVVTEKSHQRMASTEQCLPRLSAYLFTQPFLSFAQKFIVSLLSYWCLFTLLYCISLFKVGICPIFNKLTVTVIIIVWIVIVVLYVCAWKLTTIILT